MMSTLPTIQHIFLGQHQFNLIMLKFLCQAVGCVCQVWHYRAKLLDVFNSQVWHYQVCLMSAVYCDHFEEQLHVAKATLPSVYSLYQFFLAR